MGSPASAMFGLQDSVPGLPQVRGPVTTALKEEPLGATSHHALAARSWMQPAIVDPNG